MASLTKSKTVFGFTSPRTLEKIIPELSLLSQHFSGKKWKGDQENQIKFFRILYESDFYEGDTYPNDPALAARDRITRAPKALGFIDLEPEIQLTQAGQLLLSEKRIHETFTRQLLKFQLPSPYHTQSTAIHFSVKPYLELLRLIADIGYISKTEIALFFIQMTNFEFYDLIKTKIKLFRKNRKDHKGSYKIYVNKCFENEINNIYAEEISSKNLKTRESSENSLDKFMKTKMSNMKDYADAFFRYIRSTELVTLDRKTFRLVVSPNKTEEVDFLLKNIDRKPKCFKSNDEFKNYLFNPYSIELLSDDRDLLIKKIKKIDSAYESANEDIEELKDILEKKQEMIKFEIISNKKNELKDIKKIDDIIDIFEKIKSKDVPDAPLFLEWNVWRSFVMLNHAKRIDGNFIMDMDGMPLNTAPGGKADIEIEFEDFGLISEVTLSGGETQFKMEADSVPRHYGQFKSNLNKNAYCIFIAPKISTGTKSFFYGLNRINTKNYGGKTKIIPLSLDDFIGFIKSGIESNFSDPFKLKNWLEEQWLNTENVCDEDVWFEEIRQNVSTWAL